MAGGAFFTLLCTWTRQILVQEQGLCIRWDATRAGSCAQDR